MVKEIRVNATKIEFEDDELGATRSLKQLSDGTYVTNIATGAEVTTGTNNTKIVTPKAIGDALVNTRLKSKLITITRDLTAASGDVSYTGVGFTPTSMQQVGTITSAGTSARCMGHVDSLKAGFCISEYDGTTIGANANFIFLYAPLSANKQLADVSTYDADGFKLTWTKIGSPTGTASFGILCFR